MFGLEESHGQEHELGLDNLWLSLLYHNGTSAFGIGFPIDLLNLDTCKFTVLTQELKGIDVPTTGTTFLMTRCGLEGAGPVGPGVLWVLRTFNGFGHNLNLGYTLATLTMGRSDTVTTCITTTNHNIFSFSGDALIL